MFVPYVSGLSAAFATDREIFGYAMEKNVLLLSPMTFYAFLKSVSIGWQENAMSKNAKEIAKQSKELIKRFETFYGHFDKIDKALSSARNAYDSAVSSYNSRLLPAFNRFETLSNGTEQNLLEENIE
jgi:DNA recombination protein RmuC